MCTSRVPRMWHPVVLLHFAGMLKPSKSNVNRKQSPCTNSIASPYSIRSLQVLAHTSVRKLIAARTIVVITCVNTEVKDISAHCSEGEGYLLSSPQNSIRPSRGPSVVPLAAGLTQAPEDLHCPQRATTRIFGLQSSR